MLNGQKTWTTLGHYANRIFCLVRTDPAAAKKQQGISFILVDMNSPGNRDPPDHHARRRARGSTRCFFTDVRVPVENRVGEENHGWTYAKYLLTYERTNIAGIGGSVAALDWLRQIANQQMQDGRPLARDPYFARRAWRVSRSTSRT